MNYIGHLAVRCYSRDVELRTPLGPEGARVFLKILAVPWFSGKKPLQRSLRISGAGVFFSAWGAPSKERGPKGAWFLGPPKGPAFGKRPRPFLTRRVLGLVPGTVCQLRNVLVQRSLWRSLRDGRAWCLWGRSGSSRAPFLSPRRARSLVKWRRPQTEERARRGVRPFFRNF